SGRRVNDMMGMFVANKIIKLMVKKGRRVEGGKALILGITFKENCPDIRNSKVIDIYRELVAFGMQVDVYDPHASRKEVQEEYGLHLVDGVTRQYDAVLLAVAHDEFSRIDYRALKNGHDAVIFDAKALLERSLVDARL